MSRRGRPPLSGRGGRTPHDDGILDRHEISELIRQSINPDKQPASVRALNDSSLYNTEFMQRFSRIFGRRTVAIPRPKTQRTSSLRVFGSNGTGQTISIGQTNLIGQPSFGSGSTVAPGLDTKIDGILGQLVFDKKLSYKDVNELQAYITRGNTSSRIFLQGTEEQRISLIQEWLNEARASLN